MSILENEFFLIKERSSLYTKEKYKYQLPLFNIYTQKDLEYSVGYRLQQDCFSSSFKTNFSVDDESNRNAKQDDEVDQSQQKPYYPSWINNCPLYNQVDNLNPYDEAYFNPIVDEDFGGLNKQLIGEISQKDQEKGDNNTENPAIRLSSIAWESVYCSSENGETEESIKKSVSKNETPKEKFTKFSSLSKKIKKKAMKEKQKKKLSKVKNKKSIKKSKKYLSKKTRAKIEVPKLQKTYKLQIDTCNNIVKNYGKAMAAFAVNDAAISYLQPLLRLHKVSYEGFAKFIYSHKESIDCIGSLRDVLLINDENPKIIKIYKNIFREICIIFLKYFAANWIYNGKMARKKDHLNCRFQLMRREYVKPKENMAMNFLNFRRELEYTKCKKITQSNPY